MTTPAELAAIVLLSHAMVGGYFTATDGWVKYGCFLCGPVFTDNAGHATHLAAALASAGLLTTEPDVLP